MLILSISVRCERQIITTVREVRKNYFLGKRTRRIDTFEKGTRFDGKVRIRESIAERKTGKTI